MAYLDCMIWELNKFPRYGKLRDGYTIANIFHYCSDTKEYQNNNVNIQIPEFEIVATPEQLQFVYKYKEKIIENKIPVILNSINNGIETWSVDLFKANFLQYLKR